MKSKIKRIKNKIKNMFLGVGTAFACLQMNALKMYNDAFSAAENGVNEFWSKSFSFYKKLFPIIFLAFLFYRGFSSDERKKAWAGKAAIWSVVIYIIAVNYAYLGTWIENIANWFHG